MIKKDLILGAGFLGLIAVGIYLLVVFGGPSNAGQTALLANSVQGWAKGNQESKVALVEYGDFQCPACAAYHPLLNKLDQELGDRIKFIYRHFPLTQIHRNAESAARASEAAGSQGKFWEMYDLIFAGHRDWAESVNAEVIFESYAEKLGLDLGQFRSDVQSTAVAEKVRNDYESGVAAGIAGTPTFFLNGKVLENPRSYEQFKSLILEELDARQ